jgi:transposase
MITDRQYQQLLSGQTKGYTLKKNAIKAGVSENTARKYLKTRNKPSKAKPVHDWRTRKDPLEEVWQEQIKPMLNREPELEAVTLIEYLEKQYPDRVWQRHLRTMQRRIRKWRWQEGPEKEVFFPQDRKPGVVAQFDWTRLGELGVTIMGEILNRMLFHLVFAYSNWQWAKLCQSESFSSLKEGLQSGLKSMGKVPVELWCDNTSTATHQLKRGSQKRGLNRRYQELCDHWVVEPRTIEIGKPNQNGDVESSNGHLKRRLDQALMIRGSRDFESLEAFEVFVQNLIQELNEKVEIKRQEELLVMRDLPVSHWSEFEETIARVTRSSTICVKRSFYSVPSRLIGSMLRVHIYEDRIEAYFDHEKVLSAPRGSKAVIDYRHVLPTLLRKPGAFENYHWQESLYPDSLFRTAYDQMVKVQGKQKAIRDYLRILELCQNHGEKTIAHLVEEILQDPKTELSSDELSQRLGTYDQMRVEFGREPDWDVDLGIYDGIIKREEVLA